MELSNPTGGKVTIEINTQEPFVEPLRIFEVVMCKELMAGYLVKLESRGRYDGEPIDADISVQLTYDQPLEVGTMVTGRVGDAVSGSFAKGEWYAGR